MVIKYHQKVSSDSPLNKWTSLYGLTDFWRWRFSTDRAFTCQSASYRKMSRIDLVYVSGGCFPRVREVPMLPRGISDHAPMLLCLQTQTPPSESLWRLSHYWISEEIIEAEIAKCIADYWISNSNSSALHVRWDAFKAYIRGCYQTSISRTRYNTKISIEEAEAKAQGLESQYVLPHNPITLLDMQAAYRKVMPLRVAGAKKQLTQSQRIFEQGEKTGHLLAWLVKEQQPITTIACIKAADGTPVTDPVAINACSASYYSSLYSSKVDYTGEELDSFLGQFTFPTLSKEARNHLDSTIILEEVQQTLSELQAGKTPVVDGLPPPEVL